MKKLLWIILGLFTIEVLGIVGCNWIAGGYAGDATLTLSKYVGLNLWSCIAFGIINLAIIILVALYAYHTQKLGQALLFTFMIICFFILSICPHLPYESPIVLMHQIFATCMFVFMLLIGIGTYNKSQKVARIASGIFVLFGLHFIFAYANRLPYFMDTILYWEVAYIYLFFVDLIATAPKIEAKSKSKD